MIPGPCVRDLLHEFDPVSGWCLNGCGWREDGRSAYRSRPLRATARRLEYADITEPRRSPHSAEESQ